MTHGRILVAGIGNIFMGDDAFGCEVCQQLVQRRWPAEVHIVDFGIRGFDLAYALMDGYETTILVDATPQGGAPGSIYTLELNLNDVGASPDFADAHSMHPLNVLRMVKSMGGQTGQILLVGCEPAELGDPLLGKMGLSKPVTASVIAAAQTIELLIKQRLSNDHTAAAGSDQRTVSA